MTSCKNICPDVTPAQCDPILIGAFYSCKLVCTIYDAQYSTHSFIASAAPLCTSSLLSIVETSIHNVLLQNILDPDIRADVKGIIENTTIGERRTSFVICPTMRTMWQIGATRGGGHYISMLGPTNCDSTEKHHHSIFPTF